MQRLERLYARLDELNISCLVITKPINIFYLIGLEVSVGMLIIEKGNFHLFLDSRYRQEAIEKGLDLDEGPFERFFSIHKNVHVEGDFLTFNQWIDFKKKGPHTEFIPLAVVEELRMIKDAKEISLLKEAANKTVQTMQKVLKALEVGISEKELEVLVQAPSFRPIIAFGSNAAHIHHRPTDRRYRANEGVLIDLGVKHEGYMGDMTRTFFSPLADKVQQASESVLEHIKPGMTLYELDLMVKKQIPFKDHSLSHGIGLEVHERPLFKHDSKVLLEPGMCITIEPGLYVPGEGGARHENMVLVTSTGCEVLTK